MQNISVRCSSSAKSTALQTTDFSLPLCSCIFVPGITARMTAAAVREDLTSWRIMWREGKGRPHSTVESPSPPGHAQSANVIVVARAEVLTCSGGIHATVGDVLQFTDAPMWFARILSVFSCRISSLILWFSLCSSNRTCTVQ